MLKEQFGADRVILFGSLAHEVWFYERSDIGLAVEGVSADRFYKAWNELEQPDSSVEISLVELEASSERLSNELAGYGMDL